MKFFLKKKKYKAFTLAEILLAIGLFSAIALFSVPIYSTFLSQNELDTALNLSIREIRTAQTYAMTSKEDSDWGINFSGNQITIFKGNDFELRENSFDIVNYAPSTIDFSGNTSINFEKISGETTNAGALNISNSNGTSTIVINNFGISEY